VRLQRQRGQWSISRVFRSGPKGAPHLRSRSRLGRSARPTANDDIEIWQGFFHRTYTTDEMDFFHEYGGDPLKPSLFELVVQEQLRDLLQPALKYVLSVGLIIVIVQSTELLK
jgi:hypothetical protein